MLTRRLTMTSLNRRHFLGLCAAASLPALAGSIRALHKEPRYAHPAYWAPFVLVGDGAGR